MNRNLFQIAALLACALLISACASTPKGPPSEVVRLQMQLDSMRADSRIGPYADIELREAQRVVDALATDARRLRKDDYDYRLYMADRLVQIAEAEGLARHAGERTEALSREREHMLIRAREAEADWARRDARSAQAMAEAERLRAEQERHRAELGRSEAVRARDEARDAQAIAEAERLRAEEERLLAQRARADAEQKRLEAQRAREEAEHAQRQLQSLQAQLADLEARQTDRGLVVTLGDVLFEVDRSELKPGAARNLDKLVAALTDHPQTRVEIEGHTDSTGSPEYNLGLSERRANAVRAYLIGGGIDPARLSARGLGLDFPVATNATAEGRQQNRRVEIVIEQHDPRISQH
jgi:outer membrane protein OmpA-like peptidoglycan-associated protein